MEFLIKMVQQQTKLEIADNSGVKIAKCIKILSKKKHGKIGDIVIVSVKKLKKNSNFKKLAKKSISKAVIVTTSKVVKHNNGFFVKFKNNSIAFIDNQTNNPISSRIFNLISKKLKKKFNKLVSLTSYLI